MRELIDESIDALGEVFDPLVRTVTLGYMLLAADRRHLDNAAGIASAFLAHLDLLGSTSDERFDDPRRRAALDDAVRELCQTSLTVLQDDPTDAHARVQRRDASSTSASADHHSIDGSPRRRACPMTKRSRLRQNFSQDVLGRLEFALRAQPATAALAIRATTRGHTMFVLCTSSGLSVTSAAGEYADAARRLAELVQSDNAAVEIIGEPSSVQVYEQAGRALHDALPESVREVLHAASSVLLALDDFAGNDPFPFELLHDGDGWLATSTVIARFPSIASLVRAAEGATTPTAEHRALVVAVPDVPGYDHLSSADEEATWVRGWLERAKWDAPAIAASTLTASSCWRDCRM